MLSLASAHCTTQHTGRVNKQISINKMCQAATLYYTKQSAAAKQIAKRRETETETE